MVFLEYTSNFQHFQKKDEARGSTINLQATLLSDCFINMGDIQLENVPLSKI